MASSQTFRLKDSDLDLLTERVRPLDPELATLLAHRPFEFSRAFAKGARQFDSNLKQTTRIAQEFGEAATQFWSHLMGALEDFTCSAASSQPVVEPPVKEMVSPLTAFEMGVRAKQDALFHRFFKPTDIWNDTIEEEPPTPPNVASSESPASESPASTLPNAASSESPAPPPGAKITANSGGSSAGGGILNVTVGVRDLTSLAHKVDLTSSIGEITFTSGSGCSGCPGCRTEHHDGAGDLGDRANSLRSSLKREP